MYELKEDLSIENMIYEIRGKQVMLDCDLAKLYNVETKRISKKHIFSKICEFIPQFIIHHS